MSLHKFQDQRDIEEREILLLKNERLHAENLRMYLELNKRICVNCNNVEQKQKILQDLQNENARLIEEVSFHFLLINYMLLELFINIYVFILKHSKMKYFWRIRYAFVNMVNSCYFFAHNHSHIFSFSIF